LNLFKVKRFYNDVKEEEDMAGSLESRLGNLEELVIIIIITIWGGGRGGGHGPGIPDPAAIDMTRIEALRRVLGPIPDPFSPDTTRMTLEAVESRLLSINAELTRLRSHEAELNARLKELRGSKSK
jgi:hypothetical protein